MKCVLGCLLVLMVVSPLLADQNSSTEAPLYEVNRTTAPPVIDGVVSPGEWAAASEAAGSWVNLRAHTADSHNLRFQAMWDDDNLYLVGMSDYAGFIPAVESGSAIPADPDSTSELLDAPRTAQPDYYNPSFYIDPNVDGERVWTGSVDVDGEVVADTQVDGYLISWNVYEGFAARRPTEGMPEQALRDPLEAGSQINDYYSGLTLEAHANDIFGNQGEWPLDDTGPNGSHLDDGFPGLVYAQNASNTDLNETGIPGAVWEWSISWDTFNATNPNRVVTEEEAEARPEFVVDTREFIEIPDPFFPGFTIEVENPDFNQEVPNVGQLLGIEAFIGNAGEPDLRFSDPESPVFIDNGLYVAQAPADGDVWAFEAGATTNDIENVFSSWSEPLNGDPSRDFFAVWRGTEHGRLLFVGGGGGLCNPDTKGDLDGDGSVGFADFLVLSGNFGNEVSSHTEGDIDCDGSVGFSDFLALSANFGTTVAAAQSVPEPDAVALLGVAGMVCVAFRRRRQARGSAAR